MIRLMRRIVFARGARSMLTLTLLLGGCGGGEEDPTGRAAPAQAVPDIQADAKDRPAQAEAVDVRSAPGPSKRRKARSRDWNGVTSLVAARSGDVIGAADNKGRVRVLDSTDTRVRTTVAGHRGAAVTGVVFSADGRSLISVGRDSVAEVWSVADGKRMLTLNGHEQPVRTVAASGGGDLIATGGEETRVMLWNARSGRLQRILYGASDFVNSVAFSPDGRLLAAGDAAARVYLWDTATGALRATLLGHAGEINAVAFSPDGKLLASAGVDMRVLTWNVAAAQQTGTLKGHQAAVRSLAFAPDGHTLASGDEDGVIEIWDTDQERSTKRLVAGTAPINALAFHPRNADRLFTGSDSGQVTAWSVARGAAN